jgi:hypothetical protein
VRDWADYEGLEDEELAAEIAGLDGYLEKVLRARAHDAFPADHPSGQTPREPLSAGPSGRQRGAPDRRRGGGAGRC